MAVLQEFLIVVFAVPTIKFFVKSINTAMISTCKMANVFLKLQLCARQMDKTPAFVELLKLKLVPR